MVIVACCFAIATLFVACLYYGWVRYRLKYCVSVTATDTSHLPVEWEVSKVPIPPSPITSLDISPLPQYVSRDPSFNFSNCTEANNVGGNNLNNSVNANVNVDDVELILQNEEWVLQPDDVTIVKSIVLGRGGFGIVYAGNVYLLSYTVVKYIYIMFGV